VFRVVSGQHLPLAEHQQLKPRQEAVGITSRGKPAAALAALRGERAFPPRHMSRPPARFPGILLTVEWEFLAF
jgi:hypothetical protein